MLKLRITEEINSTGVETEGENDHKGIFIKQNNQNGGVAKLFYFAFITCVE